MINTDTDLQPLLTALHKYATGPCEDLFDAPTPVQHCTCNGAGITTPELVTEWHVSDSGLRYSHKVCLSGTGCGRRCKKLKINMVKCVTNTRFASISHVYHLLQLGR